MSINDYITERIVACKENKTYCKNYEEQEIKVMHCTIVLIMLLQYQFSKDEQYGCKKILDEIEPIKGDVEPIFDIYDNENYIFYKRDLATDCFKYNLLKAEHECFSYDKDYINRICRESHTCGDEFAQEYCTNDKISEIIQDTLGILNRNDTELEKIIDTNEEIRICKSDHRIFLAMIVIKIYRLSKNDERKKDNDDLERQFDKIIEFYYKVNSSEDRWKHYEDNENAIRKLKERNNKEINNEEINNEEINDERSVTWRKEEKYRLLHECEFQDTGGHALNNFDNGLRTLLENDIRNPLGAFPLMVEKLKIKKVSKFNAFLHNFLKKLKH